MPKGTIPAVSVLMPAYNAEKYLREAIDSILSQTFADFELIIINDGSKDATKDIILGYDDVRIVYIENGQNSGICHTLNRGVEASRGRYIVRMDSDDISLPARLATQVAFMDAHPDVGVAGSMVERIFVDSNTSDFPPSQTDYYQCKADLLLSTCVAHPATIIRSSVLKEYNLRYDDYFRGMEDHHLWWRMARHTHITNIPKALLKYRIHQNQVTQIPPTEEFLSRKRDFIRLRLTDLGIAATEQEIDALLRYEMRPATFDDSSLLDLMSCMQKIACLQVNESKYHEALKNISGSAISHACDLSHKQLKKKNSYYMWKAYRMGFLSFSLFAKRLLR